MSTATSLGFTITSRYNGDGTRRATRDLNDLDRQAGTTSSTLGEATGGLSGMATAALGLGPALIPVGAGIAAVGGAAVTMAASVGAAGGLFAALALTAAKNAGKMGAVGKQFQGAEKGVKSAWMDLATTTAKYTLGPMTTVLDGVAKAIPKLTPIMAAMAPVADRVAKSISGFLTGPRLVAGVNFVKKFGVPALSTLATALGHLADFGARAALAFGPLVPKIAGGIEKITGAMSKWADGGGFQRFLDYVQKNAGSLRQFFSNLVTFAQNLAKAFVELAPKSFVVVGLLAKLLAAIPPSGLAAIVVGLVALKVAIIGINIATMEGPWGWIAAAIALVAAGIYLLATKTQFFQTQWKLAMTVFNVGWGVVKAVWNWTKKNWPLLLSILTGPIGAATIYIVRHWTQIKNGASAAWSAVKKFVTTNFHAAYTYVVNTGKSIVSFIKSLPGKITSAAAGMFGGIVKAAKSAVSSAKSVIGSIASALGLKTGGPVGFATGGHVRHFAPGGHVWGAGTATSDSIPAMLSNGEYVINARTVNRLGLPMLNALNFGGGSTWANSGPVTSVSQASRVSSVSGAGGTGTTVEFNNCFFAGASKSQFTEIMVAGLRDLKRKGRTF
jgi:hypothetical protein